MKSIITPVLILLLCCEIFPQDLPSFSPQAYTRIREHVFNVLNYGAVGDSTTSDSAAFQDAVDAMSTGDVLFIPVGNYYLPTDSLVLPKGCSIVGQGARSKILMTGDGRIHIDSAGWADNFCLTPYDTSSIVYDTTGALGPILHIGKGSGQSYDAQISHIYGFCGIWVTYVNNISVTNCKIRGPDY